MIVPRAAKERAEADVCSLSPVPSPVLVPRAPRAAPVPLLKMPESNAPARHASANVKVYLDHQRVKMTSVVPTTIRA